MRRLLASCSIDICPSNSPSYTYLHTGRGRGKSLTQLAGKSDCMCQYECTCHIRGPAQISLCNILKLDFLFCNRQPTTPYRVDRRVKAYSLCAACWCVLVVKKKKIKEKKKNSTGQLCKYHKTHKVAVWQCNLTIVLLFTHKSRYTHFEVAALQYNWCVCFCFCGRTCKQVVKFEMLWPPMQAHNDVRVQCTKAHCLH